MRTTKIVKIEPFLLRSKLDEPFYFSQFGYQERKICVVRITLDNGLTGWGEGYGPGLIVKAGIEQLTPMALGKDPLQLENIWQDMYRVSYDYGRKGIYLSALSAIDIALWDLKGKLLHQPVSVLLGGRKRENVKIYATGLYFTHGGNMPEKLKAEAIGYKEQGFSALKMKVGLGIEKDVKNVAAVRNAVGEKMGIMIDANHAYSLREARQLIAEVEKYSINWFEEPILNEDYDGYAELRRTSPIPISGGECEYLKFGAAEMLSKRCVDLFQPDTCACGGITEVKKMMAIAQAFHTNLTPHSWGSGIAIAANLHLVSNLDVVPHRLFPSEPILEFDCSPNKIREELLLKPFVPENGALDVPTAGGLGIEISEDKLNEFLINP